MTTSSSYRAWRGAGPARPPPRFFPALAGPYPNLNLTLTLTRVLTLTLNLTLILILTLTLTLIRSFPAHAGPLIAPGCRWSAVSSIRLRAFISRAAFRR